MSSKTRFSIESYSGVCVNLLDPDPDTIYIEDIAHHLSRINRFTGATEGYYGYNVAQHSIWVMHYILIKTEQPSIALDGLLHDAPEAYIGDISSPLKNLIRDVWAPIESNMHDKIYEALELPNYVKDSYIDKYVKEADLQAVVSEASELLSTCDSELWGKYEKPNLIAKKVSNYIAPIVPTPPHLSESLFLAKYRGLMEECGYVG